MTPMNNPIQQIMQLLQAGRNPNAVIETVIQSNPQANQVMQMLRGKSSRQLEQMVRNMCKERGITPEDFARSLGITIPSSR